MADFKSLDSTFSQAVAAAVAGGVDGAAGVAEVAPPPSRCPPRPERLISGGPGRSVGGARTRAYPQTLQHQQGG